MRFCCNCGGRLPEEGSFCPYCGAKLPTAPSAETAPQADRAVPWYSQPQAPYGNNQPPYGNNQPPYGNNQIPYGNNQPPYGYSQPPYGYSQPPYRYSQSPHPYNAAPYRYAPVPVRAPAAKPKKLDDPMSRAYRLTTLSTLVTYAMVTQVSSAVISLAAAFCVMFFRERLSLDGSNSILSLLENGPLVRILLTVRVIGYVGGLLLGLLVSKTIRRRLPAQPPERRSLSPAAFLICALAAFGLWGAGVLIGNFPAFLVPVEAMDFGWNAFPTWVLAVVVAPVFEELIFRKLVLDRIGGFGEAPAVLCSALIFGLAHQNAGQFFLAFLLGILFARIYLRTGRIVYTMVLHFMINLTATFDEVGLLLWGGSFELWYLIGLGALALVGLVLLVLFRRDPILSLPGHLSPEERMKSLRCWPVTLVKWICVYAIAITGLASAGMTLLGGSFRVSRQLQPLGLLYLIPTSLAVVLILVLARKPKRQPVPAAAEMQNAKWKMQNEAAVEEGGVCRDGTLPSAPVQTTPAAAEMQNAECKMQNAGNEMA